MIADIDRKIVSGASVPGCRLTAAVRNQRTETWADGIHHEANALGARALSRRNIPCANESDDG